MMANLRIPMFLLTGLFLAGCGKPPMAVPAGAPGTELVEIPPTQKPEDAPAALGESRLLIEKEKAEQKVATSSVSELLDPEKAKEAGLKIEVIAPGQGEGAKTGQMVRVHYTGTFTDGKVFDSSVSRNTPFDFRLGEMQVIAGWEVGILGMKKGEKRKLTIPSVMAYGERGRGNIPPDTTLLFDVELLEIK
jgi:FKBP-type peptidyl-prolyl cis-trans isomerase